MKIHFIFASLLLMSFASMRCMETAENDQVKPYTVQEVDQYCVNIDLYFPDDNNKCPLIDLALDSSSNLSDIIRDQVGYKRLLISSQDAKDAFLANLQNRLMRKWQHLGYPHRDPRDWAEIRTWLAICVMINAKSKDSSCGGLGKDFATKLAEKAKDQQLIDLLKAHSEKK